MADDKCKPGKDSDIDVLLLDKDLCQRKLGFEMSVDRYGKQVMAFTRYLALRYGRCLDPRDAYQETFTCFFEMVKEGRYKPQGKVRAVLFRIDRNRVANFGRQLKRDREHIDGGALIDETVVPNAVPSLLEGLERQDMQKWLKKKGLRQAVWDGLDTLTPNQWEVYTTWLDLFDDFGNPPTLYTLVDEIYEWPPTEEEQKKLKDSVRKTRDRAEELLNNYLAIRGFWP